MMFINLKPEKNLPAWGFRMLVGPAMVIDGTVHFFTLGFVSLGASLWVTRHLARQRIRRIRHIQHPAK